MAQLNRKRILLVDDSKTTRAMIKRVIGMLDLEIEEVLEANDGKEGLAVLDSTRVDLVLADLNMPVMDGYEMIDRMSRSETLKGIPVVVISAQPDPEQVARLKRNGVAGYLPKPFTAEGIRDMIAPLFDAAAASVPVELTQADRSQLALAAALAEALQTMAFISPEPIPVGEPATLPEGSRLVSIDFKGETTKGSLALAAPPAFGEAMAANLDIVESTGGDDALKELANIACGMFLRSRRGGGTGFHLSHPHVSSLPESNITTLFKASDSVSLQADGHLIAAQAVIDAAFYRS